MAAYRADADAVAFAGGYWKSGGIGAVDVDGFVRIADRKKDMINRAGFKVYLTEVESVLTGIDGVIEAAVVGRPDGPHRCGDVDPALRQCA